MNKNSRKPMNSNKRNLKKVETGNGVPSLQVIVDIINALECSADELLCIEVDKARPYYDSWIKELLADCIRQDIMLITDVDKTLKNSLRKLEI